jgi:hypothetical protein
MRPGPRRCQVLKEDLQMIPENARPNGKSKVDGSLRGCAILLALALFSSILAAQSDSALRKRDTTIRRAHSLVVAGDSARGKTGGVAAQIRSLLDTTTITLDRLEVHRTSFIGTGGLAASAASSFTRRGDAGGAWDARSAAGASGSTCDGWCVDLRGF